MKYKWMIRHIKTENLHDVDEKIKIRIAYVEKVSRTLGYKIQFYGGEAIILVRSNPDDRENDVVIRIDLLNFDTITTLTHPSKGRRDLKRSELTLKDLTSVLYNPRSHTNKGRYV